MADIHPDWPAPHNVKALTTVRDGGLSVSPFHTFNMGLHCGDENKHVLANREILLVRAALPAPPQWLNQTHSTICVVPEEENTRHADAAITRKADTVLSIMTADCLPVLFCNRQGNEIAAVHAGWKGMVNGVIENTLQKMQSPKKELLAWIGPAICKQCFEVGDDVRDFYLKVHPDTEPFFSRRRNKWLADLSGICEHILQKNDLNDIYKSNLCTYEQKNDFFSYRRDQQTGRMATLIWFHNSQD